MPQSTAYTRYRAEADFALSRLKFSREVGEAVRAEHWHQAWSRAEASAEAEAREKGGGARVARLKNLGPLRPLPDDVPPLATNPKLPLGEISRDAEALALPVHDDRATSAESAPAHGPSLEEEVVPPPPDEALQRAMQRHAVIDGALRAGGPNPFPEEMNEGQWQYHLTAFRVGGPCECELLQAAEEAVEEIVEFLPEYWELGDEQESADGLGLQSPVLLESLDIYVESLPELTEEELRADLISNLEAAGSNDLTRLIEAELRRRATAPETEASSVEGVRTGENDGTRELSHVRVGNKLDEASTTDDVPSTRQRKITYGASARRAVGRNPFPQSPKGVVDVPAPPTKAEHTTAPAWVDAAGRTRTWSLLDPSGEKLAEIATKRDAEKMAALLNKLLTRPAATSP